MTPAQLHSYLVQKLVHYQLDSSPYPKMPLPIREHLDRLRHEVFFNVRAQLKEETPC